MMEGGDAANMLRILVATDCHLGYMEKDEVRRHDSFHAFEEICAIAERQRVDFVLLGGDLFHENKPSRSTLVKAIEILRRYCLNDRPVPFQVVSDQTLNFQNAFGHVNYEDPHFNVGLPVFTIHGNHDDPAGVDNLSVVDILSACNLVNYFGKTVLGGSGVGQITLHPILIRKGSTAVALYGLGNIRDERLNRMFQTPHAVQWMRPESQEGCQVSDWFNILVLHQNRVKTNPKNAINEHFLPRFLDFIVWGHEHECLVDPQEVPGMGFHISQPGSSVATSLIDGESKPKHVLLVEIKGNQYRPTKIPLMSVRPFEYTEVILKDEPDIDPNDQSSILEHLDKVVGKLIEKSSKQAVNRKELKLPLIRVKVDYSGFMTINPQRFGQKYVGKVANPQDILIFSKATKRAKVEGKIDDSERLRPEELNQQNIEALVAESNLKMEILPVNDLDIALQNFVNKDDKLAFYSCVQYNIQETRNKIAKDSDKLKFEEEDLIIKVGECLEERVKGRSAPSKESTQLNAGAQPWKDFQGRSAAGTGSTAASFSDDEDAIPVSSSKPSTRGRKGSTGASQTATRGRGRGRGRGSSTMKQTTLDGALGFRSSQRSASVAAATAIQSDANEDNLASTLSDDAEKNDVEEIDDSSENESKIPPGPRRLLAATAEEHAPPHSKAETETATGFCSRKNKVPLLSVEALHHLHIFIFVLAVVHVTFSALTVIFGGARIRQWKHWEDSIAKQNYATDQVLKPKVTNVQQHDFIRDRFSGFGKDSAIVGWLISFSKQFYGSVTKSDYVTLRHGFIMTHCRTNPKFNFHKYMIRALEDDFKKVVGISWYLWLFVVIFLLLNINGWHTYFWIAFIPVILLLSVGTKLEHVITQLAHDVAEKHAAIEGDLVVQPSDEHFWFHRPRVVLFLIHFILFQNAFEIAFFFWIWVTYGFDSCIMGQVRYIIPRLVIGVFIQVLCSYSTLPLYALVTQMGTHYKRAIFNDHLQQNIVGWAQKAKRRKEQNADGNPGQGSSQESGNTGIQLGSIFPKKASGPGNSSSAPKADQTS